MEHTCPFLKMVRISMIIFLWEGSISPYIERVPQPLVNYIEGDINAYYIFLEEDINSIAQLPNPKDGMAYAL
jgi:hypothetical protein